MSLTQKTCKPCEGGAQPLSGAELEPLLTELGGQWNLMEEKKIVRTFAFRTFLQAMAFVNAVARLAEAEGHHPDIAIHYNKVTIELWTHAVGGLSENDFILAAKINTLENHANDAGQAG